MRKDICSDYSYEELEQLYREKSLQLKDTLHEIEMYRENSREIRRQNADMKQSIEHYKKENEKAFQILLSKIFPNYWKTHSMNTMEKYIFQNIIQDHEDGMLGVLTSGLGRDPMRCYMQDETYRNLDSGKKDWVVVR